MNDIEGSRDPLFSCVMIFDKDEILYASQAKSALSRKGFGSVVGERDDLGEKMANLALLPN